MLFNEMAHRKYELRRRAEKQGETRRRIALATLELHTTVGPAMTTVSAIAERAGVERLTVYRHFPDPDSLFAACGGLWTATVPMPDLDAALAEPDPVSRLDRTLREVFRYFEANESSLYPLFRDIDQVPALKRMMESGWLNAVTATRDALVAGFASPGPPPDALRATVGHALDFWAWRSFHAQGLDNDRIIELLKGMVGLLAPGPLAGRAEAPAAPLP